MTKPASRAPGLRRAMFLLAFLAPLAACKKLIDQNTFAPAPEAKPAPAANQQPAPPPPESRPALMIIEPGTKLENYRHVLRDAVNAAEARDPAVRFEVVSVVPAGHSLSEQVKLADSTRPEAVAVANALIAAGVPEGRVELGARPDPAAQHPQIRVYVR